jgi:5-methylcytosine-specific restriction endonuclease McrA
MSEISKRYSAMLGMDVSNALRKLARKMLFVFAEELGRTTCCRCGKRIETFQEMSLDHLENWIGHADAPKVFWDLANVRLAHVRCNVAEAGKRKKLSRKAKLAGHARRSRAYVQRQMTKDPEGFRARMAAHQRAFLKRKRAALD